MTSVDFGAAAETAGQWVNALLEGASALGANVRPGTEVNIFGIPLEFILFAFTLIGVAVFHHRTFTVAATGLIVITLFKLLYTGFPAGIGVEGLGAHLWEDRITLSNLFLLLLGFAVLSRQFEDSKAPDAMPALLPDNWTGGVALLAMIFCLSAFLDNIAAALVGGVIARHVYGGKVHIGYLAGIVAASNAGGSGSVLGDTTTTMMWIAGVNPLHVLHAFIAAAVAFVVFALPIAIVQQRYHPIQKHRAAGLVIDWGRVGVVIFILCCAVAANFGANMFAPHLIHTVPVIGLAVWAAILISAPVRMPDFKVVPANLKGTLFLLALVTCASMMPVEKLPEASWHTALGLGFVSSVFDNIPLTALAIDQGGYDWGVLAFAVGFGGSMVWFGSSAGVALSNMYPDAKSVGAWIRHGWWVAIGYVAGFFVLLTVLGWNPREVPAKVVAPHAADLSAPAEAGGL